MLKKVIDSAAYNNKSPIALQTLYQPGGPDGQSIGGLTHISLACFLWEIARQAVQTQIRRRNTVIEQD